MAEKKPTADPKNILDLLTAPPEALRTLDALTLSSDAQTVLSVLDEAARLERRDALENLSHELHAEQIRKEDDRLQLAMEREQFNRIERDEMARLSARAKWDASQQTAQAVPVAAPPAPVVVETPEQRRARWLAMFEAEEKREKRGALQRLANSEGVDRSNMGKDIAKARAERDTQRQAGMWTAQMVQGGKRKP